MSIKATVYQGTPGELITQMSNEIVAIFQKAGVIPSPIHVLCLIHIAANMARMYKEDPTSIGQMPSFKMMLGCLLHEWSSTPWDSEEGEAFTEEFVEIIKSMGGTRVGEKAPPMVLSPMGTQVH